MGPEEWGPRGWGLEGGGGEGWGPNPEKVGGPGGEWARRAGVPEDGEPKISRFFPSPVGNFVLSSLSGGLFRGIVAAVQFHGSQSARHFVRALAAAKTAGFSQKLTTGGEKARNFGR